MVNFSKKLMMAVMFLAVSAHGMSSVDSGIAEVLAAAEENCTYMSPSTQAVVSGVPAVDSAVSTGIFSRVWRAMPKKTILGGLVVFAAYKWFIPDKFKMNALARSLDAPWLRSNNPPDKIYLWALEDYPRFTPENTVNALKALNARVGGHRVFDARGALVRDANRNEVRVEFRVHENSVEIQKRTQHILLDVIDGEMNEVNAAMDSVCYLSTGSALSKVNVCCDVVFGAPLFECYAGWLSEKFIVSDVLGFEPPHNSREAVVNAFLRELGERGFREICARTDARAIEFKNLDHSRMPAWIATMVPGSRRLTANQVLKVNVYVLGALRLARLKQVRDLIANAVTYGDETFPHGRFALEWVV